MWYKKMDVSIIKAMYKAFSTDDSTPKDEIVKTILSRMTDGSDAEVLKDTIMSSYKERTGKSKLQYYKPYS